jgi:hypothetical protein
MAEEGPNGYIVLPLLRRFREFEYALFIFLPLPQPSEPC